MGATAEVTGAVIICVPTGKGLIYMQSLLADLTTLSALEHEGEMCDYFRTVK
jgi:hypothetical protein